MSDFYELKTAGTSPLSLTEAKSFMKVSSSSDDTIIEGIINSATEWGQKYTGREFTNNIWLLFLDYFPSRITLNRDPVDSITSVKHLVSDVNTAVDSSIYYLKKETQKSEIVLLENNEWPTNTDEREQAIEVEFITESYYCKEEILNSLKRHVSYLYSNRGDCADTKDAADSSGVTFMYDQFRISRV